MPIRDALPADAAAIARVHVDSWRTTYAGLVPDDFLAGLSYERSQKNWSRAFTDPSLNTFLLVAETEPGQVVGFASGGPLREGPPDYQGELYAIYLFQDHQRCGFGRALVAHTASRLLQRGFANMLVWVLADNPGRRFYEALGGQFITEKPFALGGATLLEAAYGWPDLQPLAESILPSSAKSA